MVREQKSSSCVFADAEYVYYMNRTVAPLSAILGTVDEFIPYRKRTQVAAAAHTTDLYAPGERGMVTCSGWRTARQSSPVALGCGTGWCVNIYILV